jgi:AraC-like DNA-binding protein
MLSSDVRAPARAGETTEKYRTHCACGSVKAVTKMHSRFSSDQGNRGAGKGVSTARTAVSGSGWHAGFVTPEDLACLRRARDLMDREYAAPLDVPAMARAALMSPSHFSRQFRVAYGETPYGYLMTRRIERAKALLRLGTLSVTEVCVEVGCTSLGSFSARFTELVGETPSAYRARTHDSLAAVPGCQLKGLTRPSRFREASRSGPA